MAIDWNYTVAQTLKNHYVKSVKNSVKSQSNRGLKE